ncbi:MAG: type II toxin-antitoxin system VapC family toxin [Planctomycetota bacterium]
MIFLDTSWLVKLYVDEDDSLAVRKAIGGDADVVVSDLAYVEFHSAIARRRRERSLAARTAAALVARFRGDWTGRVRVAISPDVLHRAADLLNEHALRSADAVQLASALLIAAGAPEAPRFGTADGRLVAAATAEGLIALEPTP